MQDNLDKFGKGWGHSVVVNGLILALVAFAAFIFLDATWQNNDRRTYQITGKCQEGLPIK